MTNLMRPPLDQRLWSKMLDEHTIRLQQRCEQADSLESSREWPSVCTFASRKYYKLHMHLPGQDERRQHLQ